jgi:hypothetical protein
MNELSACGCVFGGDKDRLQAEECGRSHDSAWWTTAHSSAGSQYQILCARSAFSWVCLTEQARNVASQLQAFTEGQVMIQSGPRSKLKAGLSADWKQNLPAVLGVQWRADHGGVQRQCRGLGPTTRVVLTARVRKKEQGAPGCAAAVTRHMSDMVKTLTSQEVNALASTCLLVS